MKNRSSYAVLTRFGIIATILAALMLIASAASAAGHLEFSYAENGEDPVATFTASDPDADAGDIEWSVGGVDGGLFEVPGGVLSFKDSPDFEDKKDGDESDDAGDQGKGDNKYQIIVKANEGEQAVQVTVTDVDELGEVKFDQPQPQATRSLKADGPNDPDGGIDEISWQWSRGPTAEGPWTEIAGATTASRTPGTDDIDMWLQATVTYVDVHGDQSVSGVTDNFVEARTLANAAPKFGDVDDITVSENTSGKIGEPVVASDGDNDVLLYDVDTASTDTDLNDNALFTVDNNGQLSLTEAEDFESPSATQPGDTPRAAVTVDGESYMPYTVVLRATDPSRASASVTVRVLISNANESPEFAKDADGNFLNTTLYIVEHGATEATGPGLGTTEALAITNADSGTTAIDYTATDEDTTTLDDAPTFTLEGADKDSFSLTAAGGLTTRQTAGTPEVLGLRANFESKPEYKITIVAASTGATGTTGRGTKYTRLDVTVKVVDREDAGEITLSVLQSQVNIPVVATHSDQDDGVTDRKWQWYRGGTLPGDLATLSSDAEGILLVTPACVDGDDPDTATVEEQTAADTLCRIAGQTAALYTPGAADVGRIIHVVANYKDDFDSGTRENASVSAEAEVQASFAANTAPVFPDQDLSTPGDQSDVAHRKVAENFEGAVGEPIPAGDADNQRDGAYGEILTYSIDDTDNFSVNQKDGQISTAVELDYETQSMYTVVLTATDPSGATDTITVMIEVTDEDDKAEISLSDSACEMDDSTLKCDYAENGEGSVATFTASDPDADADEIEWSVGGVDGGLFEVPGGVLSFKDSPDFEDKKDGDESDDAGDQGKGDNKYQIIVKANEGEQAVQVTVTDVDELGEVKFDQPQPQATRSLKADGPNDPDGGIDEISWQWSRGPTAEGPWTEIAGATTASRTPGTDDIDMWLQATVTYVDVHGDQSVSGVTDNFVEARTLANAAPKFGDVDDITVSENTSGKIGEPVVASDGDNDVLLYDVDTASTDTDLNDNALFTVDNNGQLSLTEAEDFESPSATQPGDTPRAAVTVDGESYMPYTVVLRATDPSRASASVTVRVLISNANESPEFAKDADGNFLNTTLYIVEHGATEATGPGLGTTEALAITNADSGTTAIDYTATDEDTTTLDDAPTFTLEGADKDSFSLTAAGGLTTRQTAGTPEVLGLRANFESKPEYKITIVAASTGATGTTGRGTKYTRLDVTVKVVDREDAGEITLSVLQSQVNIPVVATHSDQDDGVTDRKWQWYRGGTLPGDLATLSSDAEGILLVTPACVDGDDPDTATVEEQTAADTLCRIAGQTAALYTPGAADVGRIIHVVANYKDDFDSGTRENASVSAEAEVQASFAANTAPVFPDQDLSTPGDQSDVAHRKVAENFKGAVGEPIPAGDADNQRDGAYGEILTYSIDDTDNFSVNQKDGQISTAVELDYETQSMYTVVLTATDPSGATDTITVMIEVTDEDDAAEITLSVPPVFDDGESTERMVAENSEAGMAVGDPVVATDANGDDVTYSLGGDDAMYFDIDAMSGQITVGEGTMLDYESDKMSYSVTVTAEDGTGRSAMIAVTIMVTDVEESPCVNGGAVAQAHSGGGLDMDCQTLLDIRDDLVGDGTALNWSAETAIDQWDGVSSRGGTDRVYSIYLRGHGLAGVLPAGLNDLDALTSLQLHNNMLTGEIPDLSDLDLLERLVLNDNMLSGSVPATLGDMAELDYLYLHRNDLSGSIPAELGDATRLRRIWLHGNMLSGEIPGELGNIGRLRYLVLSSNMLSGEIPAGLADATSLKQIYLHNNMLTGMIPSELGSIMDDDGTLRRLYLNNNMLTGMIPSELGMLADLTNLRLSGNMLEGCVPADIFDAVDDGLDLMACEADDGSEDES